MNTYLKIYFEFHVNENQKIFIKYNVTVISNDNYVMSESLVNSL